jgi:uncharacterized protein YbdZ (MbtH family)
MRDNPFNDWTEDDQGNWQRVVLGTQGKVIRMECNLEPEGWDIHMHIYDGSKGFCLQLEGVHWADPKPRRITDAVRLANEGLFLISQVFAYRYVQESAGKPLQL